MNNETAPLSDEQLQKIRLGHLNAPKRSNSYANYGEANEDRRALLGYIDYLTRRTKELERDAAWGAHNGGAHQLLKIQHATSVELYNALRALSPDHAVVLKHYELSPEALSGYSDGASGGLSPAKGGV